MDVELMSIQPSDDNPAVVVEVPKGMTLQEVLARALPHMGPDNQPFQPLVKEYGQDRFRNALVAAGFEVPYVRAHDLEQLVGPHGRFSLDSQAGLQSLLDKIPFTEVPA